MNKLMKIIDWLVQRFWQLFSVVIFLLALVIKAMYAMEDYPYFTWSSLGDVVILSLTILSVYLIYINRDKIEKKIKYPILILVFGVIGILFILLVPLIPFSDMKYVTEGALCIGRGDIHQILQSEYLQFITKNLKVSIFYGLFILFLPKSVISLKLVNVFLYLLSAYFMGKICFNLGYLYPKMIFILTASFLPLILYCNHIYFDLPTLCMCTIAVYFYTLNKSLKNILLAAIFLALACSLRTLAYLFAMAIIIDYIFIYKKEKIKKEYNKYAVLLFIGIIFLFPQLNNMLVDSFLKVEKSETESIWTQFWMGINEEEFGFMHNEIYDGEKTFSDFYNLLISRNAKQNVCLFGKKIFWTWTQGTYQAQRYGFGNDVDNALNKFKYETPITKYLNYDAQKTRQLINMLCRAEYLTMFFFMIMGLYNMRERERDKYRIFLYLLLGTFLILIFYEMKSRYVLHCIIPMMVLSIRGMDRFSIFIRGNNSFNKNDSKNNAE